ncbi:MAG: hypothetical protein V3V32_02625 [Dehalococcoidia bacterium]
MTGKMSGKSITSDPDGVRGNMQYLFSGFFPINAPADVVLVWTGKVQTDSWPDLIGKCKTRSLRQVAKDYGVSHEAVRRTLKSRVDAPAEYDRY